MKGHFEVFAPPPTHHANTIQPPANNEQNTTNDSTNQNNNQRHFSIIPEDTRDPTIRDKVKPERSVWEAVKFGLWKFFYFPIRKRGLQLFFAVMWFVMCLYWNSLIQVWVQRFVILNNYTNVAPLLDLGYYLLPYIQVASLADTYMTCMIVFVIVKTFLFQGVSRGLHVVRRWLFIHGICWNLRAISIAITMLPNPYPQCTPPSIYNYYINAFLVATSYEVTCSDLFFSGHTIMMSLATCIWFTYTDSRYILIRLLIVPVLLGGIFVLISTHFHYTVDVFYGLSIGVILWLLYHYLAKTIEKWLVERLYREYVIRQRAPEYREYIEEEISYWDLAGEFLSRDEGKNTLMIVKKKVQSSTEEHAEPHKAIAFILIENEPSESATAQQRTQVDGGVPNPDQQRVIDKLYKKIHKVKQKVRERGETKAYWTYFQQFVVTGMLHFMIWFESWYDYIYFDWDTVTIERMAAKLGHGVPKTLDDNAIGVTLNS
jgi:hypothetical protein